MVKEISPGLIDCGWVSSEVLILEKDGEKTNKTGRVSIGILYLPNPREFDRSEEGRSGPRKWGRIVKGSSPSTTVTCHRWIEPKDSLSYAPVVQRIERPFPKRLMWVRFPPGAPSDQV